MPTTPVCYPGCECTRCDGQRRRTRRRSKLRRMGQGTIMDAAEAKAHVKALLASGLRQVDITKASGVRAATISELVNDQRDRIYRDTHNALLAVTPHVQRRNAAVWRVRRRVEALVALGWTFHEIERRAGLSRGYLRMVGNRGETWVMWETFEVVDAIYRDLCMTIGPSGRQRSFAANRGWVKPLEWDDIDDPNEKPRRRAERTTKYDVDHVVVDRVLAGEILRCTYGEKLEVMRRAEARGLSKKEICARMGWKEGRYTLRQDEAA